MTRAVSSSGNANLGNSPGPFDPAVTNPTTTGNGPNNAPSAVANQTPGTEGPGIGPNLGDIHNRYVQHALECAIIASIENAARSLQESPGQRRFNLVAEESEMSDEEELVDQTITAIESHTTNADDSDAEAERAWDSSPLLDRIILLGQVIFQEMEMEDDDLDEDEEMEDVDYWSQQ